MDPQLALQAFEELGTLVMLGMPVGTEFGIDMNTWNVGEKFKGVKMIPPGLHFIYYSAVSRQGETAPRTGFFHYFNQRELIVRHYDPAAEDLLNTDPDSEEVERIRSNIRDFDRFLGPYPMDSWRKWISLTQYISLEDMKRMIPLSGKISSVPELMTQSQWKSSEPANKNETPPLNPEEEGTQSSSSKVETSGQTQEDRATASFKSYKSCIPDLKPMPGTEIRFSNFPSRPYPDGATPSEITRCSLDSSYSIGKIVENIGRPEGLLGELQFAFICFLVGQVWEGWEHWRRLLSALCSAEAFILENHEIYLKIISVIHFQMQEVPEDFFVDIVENNNFLAEALKMFFANISDNTSSLPPAIVTRAQKFKDHLTSKFEWSFTMEEDDDEDAPVIVDL
ncbi:protein AAR2 homolog [Palaemon carinicauda]|uniref:protein AAR2 homolog n=1 Tax=Palaemon carinicauda TaxID=392227 RepID=UPI0035B5F28F